MLQLAGQSAAIPEIFVQPTCKQRQRVAVSQLRCRAKALVKRAANDAIVVDQRKRFVRDDFFELIFGGAGARDLRYTCFCRNMVDPVPTQCVIVDLKFSRGSFNRRAGRKKPLDPHALEMITPLTSPGSRTLLSCH